jgi:hypothetical protein
MSPFTVDKAQIVAVFTTDIFYGIYLVSLGPCLRAILWDKGAATRRVSNLTGRSVGWGFKRRKDIQWLMLVASMLFFVILTSQVSFGLLQTLQAFVEHSDNSVNFLSDVSHWLNLVMVGYCPCARHYSR